VRKIVILSTCLLILLSSTAFSKDLKLARPVKVARTAIIPFKNATGDAGLNWLSIGLAEAMTTDLQYIKGFEAKDVSGVSSVLVLDVHDIEKANSITLDALLKAARQEQFLKQIWIGTYRGDVSGVTVEIDAIEVSSGTVLTHHEFTAPLHGLLQEASKAVLDMAKQLGIAVDKDEHKRIMSIKTASVQAWKRNAEAVQYYRAYYDETLKTEEDESRKDDLLAQCQKALQDATATDPTYAEAWTNIGYFHMNREKTDEALKTFKKALTLKPYLISALAGAGMVLAAKGSGAEALPYLEQAVNLNPSLAFLYEALFASYYYSGGKDEAVALAKSLARSASASVRYETLSILAMLGDKKAALPLLMEIVKNDAEPLVRQFAVYSLGEAGDATVVPALIAALKDADAGVRTSATQALGEIGDPAAAPALLLVLTDSDKSVRFNAAEALGEIGDKSMGPAFLKLLKDPNPDVRWRAVRVLGKIRYADAVPDLIEFLRDPDAKVRRSAASALGRIGDSRAVKPLLQILQDADKDVRDGVVYALGELSSSAAVPSLITMLKKEPAKGVRRTAAYALGRIGDNAAVPALIAALKDPESEIRAGAAEALEAIGDKRAVPGLIEALKDSEWLVRDHAAKALGKIGDSAAVPALIEALSDTHKIVRNEVAQALGAIGDRNAIPALKKALNDREPSVRADAALALMQMGDQASIPVLLDVLKDMYGWWRFERAIKILADKGETSLLYDALQKGFDPRIFNEVRKSLLFPGSFKPLTGAKDPLTKAAGFYLMGLKAREEGRYADQHGAAAEALTRINTTEHTALTLWSLWLKAQAEVKLGKAGEAIRTISSAESLLGHLTNMERKGYKELFAEYTLFMKGEVLAASGKNAEAVKAYQKAIDELSKPRKYYIDPDSLRKLEAMVRTSFGALQISMGKANLQQAVETGRDYQANDSVEMENEEKRYLELARQKIAEGDYEAAQKLVEELNLRRANYVNRRMKLTLADAAKQQSIDEYRRKEQEIEDLGRKIDTLARSKAGEESQAGPRGSDDQVRQLESERIDKRRQLQVYLTGLKKTHPDIAALLGAKPLELAAIQEQLPEDTAILQYLMLPDKLVVFVIKKGGIDIVETPAKKADLKGKVESLRKAIFSRSKSKDSRKIQPLARELHATLIKPIEETQKLKGITVLGIAPNGFLHQLPFGVMMNSNNQYLIDQYTLFFMNSTSMLGVALEREKHKSKGAAGLLAVSNPDGTLPAADSEVADIAKLFDKKQVYSQKQAKKDIIEKKQKDYSILHLSTHGVFNPVDSTKSYLVMADGKLTLEDIWGLPLSGTSLTVLSACETGIGDILSGDDVVSLENAFIYAGSPTVIATLWKVADQSTAELMTLFYRNLIKGKTKAEALTEAQRELRKTYDHPFFWAAVTLRGEWR